MRRMRLEFPEEGITLTATLMEEQAPKTCQAIWERLPIEGYIRHAQWSGPEVAMHIDTSIQLEPENLIQRGVLPGDIAYWFGRGGEYVGLSDDLAEFAIFYGRGAIPGMMWGPVFVNLFAHIEGDLTAFADVCSRTRDEGRKRLVFSRME